MYYILLNRMCIIFKYENEDILKDEFFFIFNLIYIFMFFVIKYLKIVLINLNIFIFIINNYYN